MALCFIQPLAPAPHITNALPEEVSRKPPSGQLQPLHILSTRLLAGLWPRTLLLAEPFVDFFPNGIVTHGEFKVTFIYRKFINSYTDKFIILERDTSIYIYIYLNIYIYQIHILIHVSQTLYILIFHFLSECCIIESFEATAML